MRHESLVNEDWSSIVARLGGADALNATARETKALLRPRRITNAVDLLRLILAYCLGEHGLRLTAAWATAVGLVDISNVALLYRLRQCGDWLAMLVGHALAGAAPKASHGRLIRVIDATSVPKNGAKARKNNELWRIHSAFDLPDERFGHFELTNQQEGETLDRIPAVKGEIRIADRAYLQPDRMARVIEAGARWVDEAGNTIDIVGELRDTTADLLDRPIWIKCKGGPLLAVRLVAVRKPQQAAVEARRKARREAQRGGHTVSKQTLDAADWVILITSLRPEDFTADDVLALYRLRWRIELGFKRLKSLIGLKGPPGITESSARPHILAHLLASLLRDQLVDELEDSPRLAQAA